jgi:hypothetical protein
MVLVQESEATWARAAGPVSPRAKERLRAQAGQTALANAGRAGEKIRMNKLPRLKIFPQILNRGRLFGKILESQNPASLPGNKRS